MILSKSQATPALPVCLLQPRVQGSQSESQGPWDQIWESWEDLEKELIVIMMKFERRSIFYIAFTKLHNTIEGHFWEDLISSHDIFFQAKGLPRACQYRSAIFIPSVIFCVCFYL